MDFFSDYIVSAIGQFLSVVAILLIFGFLYAYRRFRGDSPDQAQVYANKRFMRMLKIICFLLLAAMILWVLIDSFAS